MMNKTITLSEQDWCMILDALQQAAELDDQVLELEHNADTQQQLHAHCNLMHTIQNALA